jgi:hypothetical protein
LKSLLLIIALGLIQISNPALPQEGPFPITPKVFHYPDEIVFNTRPYNIDLFVDFEENEIESVSLFLKTEAMDKYIEFPLKIIHARYRYQFNPLITPAKTIEYFFVVSLKDHSIYAAPLDENGYIRVVKRTLVDPAEYFKQRLSRRR